MDRTISPLSQLSTFAIGLVVLTSCSDPASFDNSVKFASGAGTIPPGAGADEISQVCPGSREWLPHTPLEVELFKPEAHPAPECPFYRGGYQNFLIATELDEQGQPAIVSYPTIDDVFQGNTPHGVRNTAARAWLGDIKQAGQREILVDRNGHTIYYGIHVNHAFADFVNTNGLQTVQAVQNADPNLFLPAGIVEFKTAWKDIDAADGVNTDDYANYITTTGWVPTLNQDANGLVHEDKDHPRLIKLALVAIHVVYTFPGHPELVWTSFQHVDPEGNPDTAPSFHVNPLIRDPNNLQKADVVSATDLLLYRGGTPANQANRATPEPQLKLDAASQSFTLSNGGSAETSIYRMFPGSKSNDIVPDDDVVSLNVNLRAVFAERADLLDPRDKRGNYALVGATWMDKPELFRLESTLQNDATSPLLQGNVLPEFSQAAERDAILATGNPGVVDVTDLSINGTQSPFSILAGEERMSSTAMESFTQAPSSFFNCFTCHNTTAINANGVPFGRDSTRKLMDAKLINVSHVFSQFVLEQTQTP